MDKNKTKTLLKTAHIPELDFISNYKLVKNYPVIVKPCNSGSSIGIDIAYNKKELKNKVKKALKYDNKYIIEDFIDAKEYECAILEYNGKILSNVGEIIPCEKFYDYKEKYVNSSKIIIPANIDSKLKKEIENISQNVFKLIECKKIARIDFLYDKKTNKIYFSEINTMPGFTEYSMYPKLIMDLGYTYKQVIDMLISK